MKNMSSFYLFPNSTNCQMFGAVVKTKNKTIVFDGGTLNDHPQMIEFLKENCGSHVDAWFFTHPHHDHLGTFVSLCKTDSEIEIDGVYCHFPTTEKLIELEGRVDAEINMWHDFDELVATRFADKFHRTSAGDVYTFDDVAARVLRVYNPEITFNFTNNSSSVYRVDGANKRILILGDLGAEAGKEVMENVPASELFADYTQMAHHGQAGADEAFYNYIKVRRCIWASPSWLWDNDSGGGKGSGPWKTLETRQWVEKMGVTEHVVEKDGLQTIEF